MRRRGKRLRSCSESFERRELGRRCSATLRMSGLSSKELAGVVCRERLCWGYLSVPGATLELSDSPQHVDSAT